MPTVQVKRGLAAALAAVNPTPLAGEIVWVSDTNTLVVGNGSSAYSSLSVISATPTSHTHGNITNAGAIGSTANLPVITTTSGVLTTGTFGTSANTFCAGNDARLSDARTPTGAAGGDLTGTYPNPTIAAGAIVTADLANDAVTYAKLQNVSTTDRLLGRSSAGAGDVEEITCTAFGRSLIDDADAAAARTTLSVQPTASPTFTGTLTAATCSFSSTVTVTSPLVLTGTVAGNVRQLRMQTSGSTRWEVGPGFDAESGSNVGSTLWITRWSDAGAFLGTPISIARATGVVTFENQLLVPAGSVSACSVAASGDPNTGLYFPSADVAAVVTNGTERVRVDASGNVGIGTATTTQRLNVVGTSSLYQSSNGTPALGSKNFYPLTVENFSAGYGLGIGGVNASTGGTYIQCQSFGSSVSYPIYMQALGGEVLIGTTTDNGAYLLQVNSQIYATNATIATSDARFKTNVESLTDATSVIESLRPVAFDFIPQEDRNFATERQVGLIAQEAQAALAGTDYADSVVAQCGDHLGLAYEKLVPVLIKALQESNARIAALEERLSNG